jgi:hypothetical protein
MEEYFIIYKYHNHHHYYDIMYHQVYIQFKSKLHDFKSIWKNFDGRLFFVNIYIDVQFFIEIFPTQ